MLDSLYDLSQRFLKIYYRDYRRYFLRDHPLESRFSIILGPRGVGKTTAMVQYLLDATDHDRLNPQILYVQADHFMVKRYSLYEIAEAFVKNGGKLICFDEIHKYPEWSLELKSINDTFPELKIVASGSSAMEIAKGSHDLSRRAIVYKMTGMSLREYLELYLGRQWEPHPLEEILENHPQIAEGIIQKIEAAKKKILPLFNQYLQHGYYPYFKEFDNIDLFNITLEQNIHTAIENDLQAIFPNLNGVSIKKLQKLVSFISESVPFTPDLKKLKRLLDIGDERTLKQYLKFLEDAGIILTVSKKGRSLSLLEKPEKIYLHNTNLAYAIGSPDRIQKGNIRENFFANILSAAHRLTTADQGDFRVDDTYTFEVGGPKKTFNQIKDVKNSYLAIDDLETGYRHRIPLWLFGFLY